MKKFEFIAKSKYFIAGSIMIILLGFIMVFVHKGFNMGLDFTGGSLITLDMGKTFSEKDISDAFAKNGIKEIQITTSGTSASKTTALVRMKTMEDGSKETELRAEVITELKKTYPKISMTSVERVGGVASGEMIESAVSAALIACLLMLIYITFRFELLSGIAAVIALLHDMLIMLAFMAIFDLTLNSSFVAAVLTIFGYSINDTIVVFDRIRENRNRLSRREYTFEMVANRSIRETMTRSINTSVTTLMTISVLYVLGVASIKEFALPIIVGLISGTYSSILIAAPIWVWLYDKPFFSKRHKSEMKYKKA
ncbi:MAG: protein translocase subunit SecF [Bacillota bacterium]